MTRENSMNCFQSIRAGLGVLKGIAVLALITTLAACTAGGAPTATTQATTPGVTTASYTGPAAANADTTAFQVNLWNNIRTPDKCGGCHHEGGQSPMFARSDDVNLAYQAAVQLVNFQQPNQSTLVLQVGSGHNCWLADPSACADTMTTWITNWAGTTASSSSAIQLVAPTDIDVAGGKQFPATAETEGSAPPDSFKETVYPLLSQFCSGCHQPSAAAPQTPYFADPNVDNAYAAAQVKMDLNTPTNSRFYERLAEDHHNCWTTPTGGAADCAGSSAAMLAAITAFANGVAVTSIDSSLVLSKGQHVTDGTVASGGNRYEASLVAKYEFKTGSGTTAYDTSGVSPEADLLLSGAVSWVGGWGISINTGGKAQATTAASSKLTSMIQASGEYSIEVWAAPANVTQANAWIVSYSGSDTTRNATLGQNVMQYEGETRSDQTSPNGQPPLLTAAGNMNAQAALQHVVLTYDPVNGQKIYVNGVFTGDIDPKKGGSLASWDNTFALVMGSEVTGKEQWTGTLKFVAIHASALTPAQVMQNFNAGVGEKYFVLFNVSALSGVPQSYIEATAAVLDSYAYQFSSPTFISLDPNVTVANIPIKGIRFGVNGVELPTGQSYATVSTTLGGTGYSATSGQLLSSVGAVVASDLGEAGDVIFLDFDQLGSFTHVHSDPGVPVPAPVYPTVLPPTYGIKNFAQVNSTLSQITGIPVSNMTVNTLYNTLQQSMPPTNDITAFLASNQTAISQLADGYCNLAVNTPSASATPLFPGLTLSAAPGTYYATPANVSLVVNALTSAAIGTNVNPANVTAVQTELTSLITTLAKTPLTGRTTATIAQAACTATLGSAAVTLQ
jgi:hypothetical protein